MYHESCIIIDQTTDAIFICGCFDYWCLHDYEEKLETKNCCIFCESLYAAWGMWAGIKGCTVDRWSL